MGGPVQIRPLFKLSWVKNPKPDRRCDYEDVECEGLRCGFSPCSHTALSQCSRESPEFLRNKFFSLQSLDMPPQMDYFYQHSRVPSVCLDQDDELDPAITCMLVGDGAVGKTSMIVSYTSNGYPTDYKQTAFDVFSGKLNNSCFSGSGPGQPKGPLTTCQWMHFNWFPILHTGQVQVDGTPVRIQLMDTAGQVRVWSEHYFYSMWVACIL